MLIRGAVVIITCVILFLLMYNNFNMYDKTIAKVVDVKTSGTEQSITLLVKNGDHKGDKLTTKNKFDPSLVYDEKYRNGDFVFLDNDEKAISGIKRDYQIGAAVLMVFGLLAIFGGSQGAFAIICMLINVVLFSLMIKLYLMGFDILYLSIGVCLIFATMILGFICKWRNMFLPALSATILSTFVVGLLVFLILKFGNTVDYDYLEFLPQPYTYDQANRFFCAQTVIGCLGAVMDITVTITACAGELISKTPNITNKQLNASVKEVADDITGTMINVVFFTNIAATIPVFIISMCNDIRFFTVIKYSAFFDISRFLVGGIAILVAIPISVLTTSIFMKRGAAK